MSESEAGRSKFTDFIWRNISSVQQYIYHHSLPTSKQHVREGSLRWI